jgi:fructose-bisphosphate aldolase class II
MTPLKELFSNYFISHQAMPAFNIDSFEIYQAVEIAVAETRLPCIVELSPGEDKFITAEKLYLLVKKANLENLPIYLNLDHCQDLGRLVQVSHLGFNMIHFDGSKLSLDENLAQSINLISQVHPQTLVEVEFNEIGSVELTNPQTALAFISQTQADLLAVSIGNRHGNAPNLPENIDLNLLSQIHQLLPGTFLTLHGGSGIPEAQIKEAIKLGVVKININTDLRLAFLASLRHQLSSQDSEKVYDYFIPAIADLKKVIKEKLLKFSNT